MIVGISGKMQSGKDTVAKMWQYVSNAGIRMHAFDDIDRWLNDERLYNTICSMPGIKTNGWQIRKFATGVKEVASILTGIPLHELERDTAKETVLPRHWNTLISEDEEITLTKTMTVRELFQRIGTDAIRNNVHPDAWVNALMSEYIPKYDDSTERVFGINIDKNTGVVAHASYPNWLISDVRFPNEAKAIKCKKGILIRVMRPCQECGIMKVHKMDCGIGRVEHLSETALDNYDKWDYVICNDGDIYKLLSNVNRIYNQLVEAGRF